MNDDERTRMLAEGSSPADATPKTHPPLTKHEVGDVLVIDIGRRREQHRITAVEEDRVGSTITYTTTLLSVVAASTDAGTPTVTVSDEALEHNSPVAQLSAAIIGGTVDQLAAQWAAAHANQPMTIGGPGSDYTLGPRQPIDPRHAFGPQITDAQLRDAGLTD
jgi:hypothetical protein